MIGDNPVNDIRGAREQMNASTIQKIHEDTPLGSEANAPDAAFTEYSQLRRFLTELSAQRR
jgi:putative hydrolase of the HAD superfamily